MTCIIGVNMSRLFYQIFAIKRTFRCHNSTAILTSQNENADTIRQHRSQMFSNELERQRSLIPRIEKIKVTLDGRDDKNIEFILNRNISTPYDVARHLSEDEMERSALALVDDVLWDMHRPLVDDCKIKLLHFQDDDPFLVNRAFWRSCSFMLGSVLETVFRDDLFVQLHSFPPPNVASGSFVADINIPCSPDWKPTKQELIVFSAAMHLLAQKAFKFERLVVKPDLAMEMFQHNRFKMQQLPSIIAQSTDKQSVTLYRAGEHVDISGGPMMANTGFLGRRCSVVAGHLIGQDIWRFQGVALPKGIFLNHFAFSILERRAAVLNEVNLSNVLN